MADNLTDGMLRACDYRRLTGDSLARFKTVARETLFVKKATTSTRLTHVVYTDGPLLRSITGKVQKISPTSSFITVRTAKLPKTDRDAEVPAQTFDIPVDYVVAYGFGPECSARMRAMLRAQYNG